MDVSYEEPKEKNKKNEDIEQIKPNVSLIESLQPIVTIEPVVKIKSICPEDTNELIIPVRPARISKQIKIIEIKETVEPKKSEKEEDLSEIEEKAVSVRTRNKLIKK